MKIFLSSMEGAKSINGIPFSKYIVDNYGPHKYILMSYFYIQKTDAERIEHIRDNSEEILIDSGAHSFQKGAKVNFEEYTERYAEFIRQFDRENVIGYFEMDVDNILSHDRILEMRRTLESVTDKIIPVWHVERGIKGFHELCEQYNGKIVAIPGFRGMEIMDHQYLSFLKVARRYNCKVHCLGMTRRKTMDKVPFDFTDSSTWLQQVVYGSTYTDGGKYAKAKGDRKAAQYVKNYLQGRKMQEKYYLKWKKECGD